MIERPTMTANDEPRDLVVRDDEADFASLRDAAIACRRRGGRLRLVDGGRLSAFELEWLGKAGADLFTSDLARTSLSEFILMNAASRKGGARTSYFHFGPLGPEAAGAPEATVGEAALREMAGSGVFIALSNTSRARDPERLIALAYDGRRGGSPLVYYHHGAVEAWLEDLARQGAWIHVGWTIAHEQDAALLGQTADAAAAAGQGLIVHVDRRADPSSLEDLFAAGAYLAFETPPPDFRSSCLRLERKAKRRIPGARAGYLYREFMR
jgi:hypothetical protein